MKVLVVASSDQELKPFSDAFIRTVSGVGPILAAAATASAILEHKPDAVFSVGSAGSYGSLSVGDCVSFGSVVTPDQDLSLFHMKRGCTLLPSGAQIGEIRLDMSSSLVLATSGTFASSPSLIAGADAADMEAYGVALSAFIAHIPCFAVKIITDIAGDGMRLSEYGFRLRDLRERMPAVVEEALRRL